MNSFSSSKRISTEQTTNDTTIVQNQKSIPLKVERQINQITQSQIEILCSKIQQPFEQLNLAFIFLQKKGIFIENGLLGQGGSAFILKAYSEWNENLAVKFIKLNQNQQIQEDFRREYEILKKFSSPYILRVFTFYNQSHNKNVSYQIIVMERCRYDLRRYINKVIYPMSGGELNIYFLCQQLAQGLLVLHSMNTIHLDIKPGNILYGYDQTWKYGDFGVAKIVSNERDFTNKLQGYTMRYSSPEQYCLAMGVPSAITKATIVCNQIIYTLIKNIPDITNINLIKTFIERQLTGVDISQNWILELKTCSIDFEEYLNPTFHKFNQIILKQMLQSKPENRISLEEVIQRLNSLLCQKISFTNNLIFPMIKGSKIPPPIKTINKSQQQQQPQNHLNLAIVSDIECNKDQEQFSPSNNKKIILSTKASKKSFHSDIKISQNDFSYSPKRLRSVHRSMDQIFSDRSNNIWDKKQQQMKEISIKGLQQSESTPKNTENSSLSPLLKNQMKGRTGSEKITIIKQENINQGINQNQMLIQSISKPTMNSNSNSQSGSFKLKLKQSQLLNSQQANTPFLFSKLQNNTKQQQISQPQKEFLFGYLQRNSLASLGKNNKK